jgi:hypothetical protein
MNTQGNKEVIEAVLIATLCATATGFVAWGFEHLRHHFAPTPKHDKDDKNE